MRYQVELPDGKRCFHEAESVIVDEGELVLHIDNLTVATYAEGMWSMYRRMP